MSDEVEAGRGEKGSAERSDAERRRRQARIFGDVLPETTRDDRADAWERDSGEGSDDWLRRQVPPHHGT